jgi:hypothetical protein
LDTQKNNSEKTLGLLSALLMVLLCFTFPINQSIVVLLGLGSSTAFNTTIKFVYLCLSVYLIIKNLRIPKTTFPIGGLWFIAFYFFYLLRMFYDLEILGVVYTEKSNFLLYSYSIGAIFIPCTAIVLNSKFINVNQLSKFIFYALLLSNLSILFNVLKDGYKPELFLVRNVIKSEYAEDELLNPITVALYGELLALYTIVCLFFLRNLIIKSSIVLILSLTIGLFCLILGASRGPLLSFILIFALLCFLYVRSRKNLFTKVNSSIFILFIFSLIVNYIMSIGDGEFFIIERMTRLPEEGDEARDVLSINAWQQFLDSPLIGDKIVERTSNFYPHNLILEILMATGVLGFLLFVPVIIKLIKKGFQYTQSLNPYFLIFVIFLPLFLSTLTSGSLIFSNEFFILSSFILSSTKIIHK